MREFVRREFLIDMAKGLGLLAISCPLSNSFSDHGLQPCSQEIRWLLQLSNDANENAKRFITVALKMPEGVKLVLRKFGARFNEHDHQSNEVVVIEAQPNCPPSTVLQTSLEELGFIACQEFVYDANVKAFLQSRETVR